MTLRMSLVIMSLFMSTMVTPETEVRRFVCRDRLGYFYEDDFKVTTCSLCYFYIIKDNPTFALNKPIRFQTLHKSPYFLVRNITNSHSDEQLTVPPAYDNETSINEVCETLNSDACDRWKSCCKEAWDCCQSQITTPPPSDVAIERRCPQTFDGWLCWNYTDAGKTATQACPDFLIKSEVSGRGIKQCGTDGHWQTDNRTRLEYTDYDSCTQKTDNQLYKATIIVGVVLNCVGIVLIVPALLIFLFNRGLRKQQRIQLHINFFLSILITSSCYLAWDIVIRLDRISSPKQQSTLHAHQDICKFLHVLHKCSRCATFFWMTCEGYFLHRLMVNAFRPPKHIYGYLMFGWGVPSVLFVLYGILRKFLNDDAMCWLLPLEGGGKSIEWVLVYTPTMLCIFTNMFFLFNILKQLVTKMVIHPNEPSTFRKALRATFILIPLFGLDQFCLIYRPSPDRGTEFYIYEFVSAVLMNSQAIVISLLFCYFNNEVKGYIKKAVSRLKLKYYMQSRGPDIRKMSVSTKSDSRKTSVSSLQIPTIQQLQNGGSNGSVTNRAFSDSDIVETTSL